MAHRERVLKDLQDVLELNNYQIAKLDKKEMRDALRIVANTANKRIKRWEDKEAKGETTSPAYQKYKRERGVRFSTRGLKTKEDLKKELKEALEFVNWQTSTVSGYKKHLKTTYESIKDKLREMGVKDYNKLKLADVDKFYKIFNRYQEMNVPSHLYKELDSDQLYIDVAELFLDYRNLTVDEIIEKLNKYYNPDIELNTSDYDLDITKERSNSYNKNLLFEEK